MLKLVTALKSAAAYQLAPPRMLIVMGMHRSGTSCVTRVLNLMGASLGPVDGRLPPGSDELHWESGEVNWINDTMLARGGGSWLSPPATLQAERRDYWRCRQLLWQFAGTKTAVLKDPRMILTYPVWRAVLPTHRLVACVRHPLDVARSLEQRNGLALSDGVQLWATYNAHLLEALRDAAAVHWVNFDEGELGIRHLVRDIAGTWGLKDTPEALGHYHPQVQHDRAPGELPPDVSRLYEDLKTRAGTPPRNPAGHAA